VDVSRRGRSSPGNPEDGAVREMREAAGLPRSSAARFIERQVSWSSMWSLAGFLRSRCALLALGPLMGHDVPMAAFSYDEIVAANIRAARARAGLDQAVIVERMRALGFRTWHRQTQGKVERGERRLLGAGELMALAWCLGTTVFELLKPADTDGLARFPSGDVIAAHSVAMSVGSYNDQAVTWEDGEPRFALTDLDQTINIVRHPRSPASPATG